MDNGIGIKDAALSPPKIIINPEGKKYADKNREWQGIPSIEKTKSGRLWVTFYGGGNGEGKGNYVILIKSDDDGASWSKPFLVVKHENPEVRNFDPCIWIDPFGKLWLFCAQSLCSEKHKKFDGRFGVWATICETPDLNNPLWSRPLRIANGVMLNKPTVISSGEWIFPCALWYNSESDDNYGLSNEMYCNVYVSKDNGETFRLTSSADIPDRNYGEHSIIELKDGKLWMLVRTHYGIGQSFSEDKGLTWSPGTKTNLGGPGSRFFITRLKSGCILLVNHYNFTGRNNLTAILSEDEGKTWKGHLLLDSRDNVSYPNGTEDEKGNIYVVYDRERKIEKEILMAVFTEEDVLSGRCKSKNSRLQVMVSKGGG